MPASSELSKSQVDRLGDRLRKGDISDDDLRSLDSFRRSFGNSYETVVSQVRDRLNLEPTGRPAKSTTSIIDKLQRESIRLSQMQDIAGCRLTVDDISAQDEAVAQVKKLFDKLIVVDRRDRPSHGYRAVHIVVEQSGKLIEIQIRTSLQHLWAEVSEKLSDTVDIAIKYGGGDKTIRGLLIRVSKLIADLEEAEGELAEHIRKLGQRDLPESVFEVKELIVEQRTEIAEVLNEMVDLYSKKRKK